MTSVQVGTTCTCIISMITSNFGYAHQNFNFCLFLIIFLYNLLLQYDRTSRLRKSVFSIEIGVLKDSFVKFCAL